MWRFKFKKVLFIGDSITHDGRYVDYLETYLRKYVKEWEGTIINVGLTCENTSGDTEESFAFPRPNINDRLERVMRLVQPDLVLACYGMNDGLQMPFSRERFEHYKAGINAVLDTVHAHGAQCWLLTPTYYDLTSLSEYDPEHYRTTDYPAPHAYRYYADVLEKYAQYIMSLEGDRAERCFDVFHPIKEHVQACREKDSTYRYGDGIHPDSIGHFIIMRTLMKGMFNITLSRVPEYVTAPQDDLFYQITADKNKVVSIAYRTAAGHSLDFLEEYSQAVPTTDADTYAAQALRRLQSMAVPCQPVHSKWEGYDRYDFLVEGREAFIILPQESRAGSPWVYRAEFFGAFDYADRALLKMGYALGYINLQDMYGCDYAVALMDRYCEEVIGRFGLNGKCHIFGFSRGGLYAVNFAVTHPEKVSSVYADAPVVDFGVWPPCFSYLGLDAANLPAAVQAQVHKGARMAQLGIPLLLIMGDNDSIVNYTSNGMRLAESYRAAGGQPKVIIKPGCEHHPHSIDPPDEIVDFVLAATE